MDVRWCQAILILYREFGTIQLMEREQASKRHNKTLIPEGQSKQTPEEIIREFNKNRIAMKYVVKGRDFVRKYELGPKLELMTDEVEYVSCLVGHIYIKDQLMKMQNLKRENHWLFGTPFSKLTEKTLKNIQDAADVYEKFMELAREERKSSGKELILEIDPDIHDIVTHGLSKARQELLKKGLNPNLTRTTIYILPNLLDWRLKSCVSKLQRKETTDS